MECFVDSKVVIFAVYQVESDYSTAKSLSCGKFQNHVR